MVMDPEAKAVVQALVAALAPLTGCAMRPMGEDAPVDSDVEQRTVTFGQYRAADTAVAAARAALASATSP